MINFKKYKYYIIFVSSFIFIFIHLKKLKEEKFLQEVKYVLYLKFFQIVLTSKNFYF